MWRTLIVVGITLLREVRESCGRREGLYHSQEMGHVDLEPYFDLSGVRSVRNVSAVEGKTATLSCTVRNLGDRRVSWIRRATHPIVLSSGSVTFTSDSRVSVTNAPGSEAWVLSIDMARRGDRGHYECQVNTDPKINLGFRLNVLPAAAVIHGKSSVFVKPGSTISLTCSIRLFSTPPTNIQWYRDTRALNLDSSRGGVSLENEKTPQGTRSMLLVTKATAEDTGNYTCQPSSGHSASVIVHVVDGENPRASQRGQGGVSRGERVHQDGLANLLLVLLLTVVTLVHQDTFSMVQPSHQGTLNMVPVARQSWKSRAIRFTSASPSPPQLKESPGSRR